MIFFSQVSHSQLCVGSLGDWCEEIEKKVKAQFVRRKNPCFLPSWKGKNPVLPYSVSFLRVTFTSHKAYFTFDTSGHKMCGVPLQQAGLCNTSWVSTINLIQALCLGDISLPRDSIRSCRLRAQSHKSATTLSNASHKPPLSPMLLSN